MPTKGGERRYRDPRQALGLRAAGRVQPRVAAQRRCVGRAGLLRHSAVGMSKSATKTFPTLSSTDDNREAPGLRRLEPTSKARADGSAGERRRSS